MIEVLTCPLCCESSSLDEGSVFERRWDHRKDDNGAFRGFEVIHQHSVNRCTNCNAFWFHGDGMKIDALVIQGAMRRAPSKPDEDWVTATNAKTNDAAAELQRGREISGK